MRISAVQRREALIEAALRVVARDGVTAATTRAVVAEAGMKLASFHYVFDSRVDMLRDVVTRVIEAERDALAPILAEFERDPLPPNAPDDDRRERLAALTRAALGAYLGSVADDPKRELGMLELTFAALRAPDLAPVASDQYAAYRELVARVLDAGATATRMRWNVPLDVLAATVVAMTDGLTIAALVGGSADLAAHIDVVVPAIVACAVPHDPEEGQPA